MYPYTIEDLLVGRTYYSQNRGSGTILSAEKNDKVDVSGGDVYLIRWASKGSIHTQYSNIVVVHPY